MRANDGRLHWSDLKLIGQSPLHYIRGLELGRDDTRSYIIGRAVHSQWLTGVAYPVWTKTKRDLRIKEYAEAYDLYGERLLNGAENVVVQSCVAALNADKDAVSLRAACTDFESELLWDRRGIPCAGRIDMGSSQLLVELKTDECSEPVSWRRKAERYGYHSQLAWYWYGRGLEVTAHDTPWPPTFCVVVEKREPYCVVVHRLDPLLLDEGNDRIERYLDRYQECKASNSWPGYTGGLWEASATFGSEEE